MRIRRSRKLLFFTIVAFAFTIGTDDITAQGEPVAQNVVPPTGTEVTNSTTIANGAYQMWIEGEPIVGALIAFCAIIAPGTFIAFMLTLLIAARRTPPPHWVGEMLRWAHHFEMWSMLEVMMLGIMVALIKIAEVASVETGIGMYAVFALMVLIPSILVTFDARELWSRVEWVEPARQRSPALPETQPR